MSRFAKLRKEKEAKKKQADEEAAKVYDSFAASFEADDSTTFVTGGRIQQGVPGLATDSSSRAGEVFEIHIQ